MEVSASCPIILLCLIIPSHEVVSVIYTVVEFSMFMLTDSLKVTMYQIVPGPRSVGSNVDLISDIVVNCSIPRSGSNVAINFFAKLKNVSCIVMFLCNIIEAVIVGGGWGWGW